MRLPGLLPIAGPPAQSVEATLRSLIREMMDHAAAMKQLAEGQNYVSGSVTLNDGATSTTVSDDRISASAVPQVTAGAGTWANTALRISSVSAGQFVISHSNEAATDRIVHWFAPIPG